MLKEVQRGKLIDGMLFVGITLIICSIEILETYSQKNKGKIELFYQSGVMWPSCLGLAVNKLKISCVPQRIDYGDLASHILKYHSKTRK
jgi:hypothetical protein